MDVPSFAFLKFENTLRNFIVTFVTVVSVTVICVRFCDYDWRFLGATSR